ncbi:MAG: hypothetical protein QXG65_04125 [Thermoplasmata archaeon]
MSAPAGDPVAAADRPRPPPRRSRWLPPALAIVVGVAVATAAFAAAGGLAPAPARSFPGPPDPEPTFAAAASDAAQVAGSYPGGPWAPLAAVAIALPIAAIESLAPLIQNLTGKAGCTVTLSGADANELTIPSTGSAASPGASSAWIFLEDNATPALLVIAVLSGEAVPVFTATGGVCAIAPLAARALPSAGTVDDSSTAVGLAGGVGGDAFLANASFALRSWGIAWPRILPDPVWNVTYGTCTLGAGNATAELFSATIDAVTSHVLTHGTYQGACPINPLSLLPIDGGASGTGT